MILRAHASLRSILKPLTARGSTFPSGHPSGDSFEARNALFKGFAGIGKTVTFHDMPNAMRFQVFEDFMNFLSYLSQDKPTQPISAVLGLNSTNLWQRAQPYIDDPRFEEMRLYFDNDDVGNAATGKLFDSVQTFSKLADMRSYYERYDDLNA